MFSENRIVLALIVIALLAIVALNPWLLWLAFD